MCFFDRRRNCVNVFFDRRRNCVDAETASMCFFDRRRNCVDAETASMCFFDRRRNCVDAETASMCFLIDAETASTQKLRQCVFLIDAETGSFSKLVEIVSALVSETDMKCRVQLVAYRSVLTFEVIGQVFKSTRRHLKLIFDYRVFSLPIRASKWKTLTPNFATANRVAFGHDNVYPFWRHFFNLNFETRIFKCDICTNIFRALVPT